MKILIILTSFVSGLIFYDTNVFKGFDDYFDTTFICQSNSITSSIFFSDSFPNIPKVIITLEKVDMWYTNAQFFLEVTNIQLTYFDLTISCSNNRVYAVRVKWYAIWGNSYQVINYISTSSIVNMTFPHTLSNAKNGFVSLTGFSYTGNFDFLLKISELISSSVSVEINSEDFTFLNLNKIGYQVVITEDDIINLGLQSSLGQYTSQPIYILSESRFVFNLQGLKYYTSDNIRLNLTYTNDSNSNTLSYQFGTWDGADTGSYHTQLLLHYQCKYFSCIKIKTQRRLVSNINDLPDKIINFINLNHQYNNIGQFELIVNQRLPYMQIEVSVKCFIGKVIQSSIHQKNNCDPSQMQVIKYKCLKNYNFIIFNLGFTSFSSASYKFKIIITTQSIELIQVLQNQVELEQQLMKIEQLEL
ncbi:unnamed protein product [Paramecium primaurelia]|uniref:H-type lectin domain-containing protein n=1 Tax=Paramecium primaurelia TaxID=5886 RepID=A0A8S1QK96_PARPR|nr:unnamed protein product [Paramecium primaurelia]